MKTNRIGFMVTLLLCLFFLFTLDSQATREVSSSPIVSELKEIADIDDVMVNKEVLGKNEEVIKREVLTRVNEEIRRKTGESPVNFDYLEIFYDKEQDGHVPIRFSMQNGMSIVPLTVESEVIFFGASLVDDFSKVVNNDTDLQLHPEVLLTDIQTSTGKEKETARYEWIDQTGQAVELKEFFTVQRVSDELFIKMTDKKDADMSVIIPVPIERLKTLNQMHPTELTGIQSPIMVDYNLPFVTESDLASYDSDTELKRFLGGLLDPHFYLQETDEKIEPKELRLAETDDELTSGDEVGVIYTLPLEDGQEIEKILAITVLPDGVLERPEDWDEIQKGSGQGSLMNPASGTKIGFYERGVPGNSNSPVYGYSMVDSNGESYLNGKRQAAFVPYENGQAVYGNASDLRKRGFSYEANPAMLVSDSYFLKNKKTGDLKEIIVDSSKSLLFVFDISLESNSMFEVMLSTYNTANRSRELAMLELGELSYYSNTPSVFVNRQSEGFYTSPSINTHDKGLLSFILRDQTGRWLSDYDKMSIGATKKRYGDYPNASANLLSDIVFSNSFDKPGFESLNLSPGSMLINGNNTAYQFGSSYKTLNKNEKLTTGYQVYMGPNVTMMHLNLSQTDVNVYEDEITNNSKIKIDYTLTDIPRASVKGNIYAANYKKEQVKVGEFTSGNGSTRATGTITLDRQLFPSVLNPVDGTVEAYHVPITAIIEGSGQSNGISSTGTYVNFRAYNFGATPIGANVPFSSEWNPQAVDYLWNPTYISTNEIRYDFIGNDTVDTKQPGIYWLKVQMTDVTTGRFEDYDVPVKVLHAGIELTKGITLAGKDILIPDYMVLRYKKPDEINQFILEESKAMAWDNVTRSPEGIDISVKSTTLKDISGAGKYTAVLQAKKGSDVQEVTVPIEVPVPLTADIKTENLPTTVLGQDLISEGSTKEWNTWVTNIEYNKLPWDADYEVKLKEFDNNNIADGETLNAIITLTVRGTSVDIPIAIKVTWGNTFAIGGGTTDIDKGESRVAFSINEAPDGSPYISSNYGNLADYKRNIVLFKGMTYYTPVIQLTMFNMQRAVPDPSNGNKLVYPITYPRKGGGRPPGQAASGDANLSMAAGDTPSQAINKFIYLDEQGGGMREKTLPVNYGDVLRIYMKEPETYRIITEGKEDTLRQAPDLPNGHTEFVAVTKEGFKPLYISHLQSSVVKITASETETKESYEQNYREEFSVDLPNTYLSVPEHLDRKLYSGIESAGFNTYPARKLKPGAGSKGSVFVIAPVPGSGGRYARLSYDLDFLAQEGALSLEGVPSDISFGTSVLQSYRQQIPQQKMNNSWGFVVRDGRHAEARDDGWVVQAKSEPFMSGVGQDSQLLEGASLILKDNQKSITINEEFQTIYQDDGSGRSRTDVNWQGKDGFYLNVPRRNIETNTEYTSQVEFLLIDGPGFVDDDSASTSD